MKCPYCGSQETKVTDKRETNDGDITRRRRECVSCGKRFTTYERVETVSLVVVKKSGNREQFDREKLKRGIARACEKRPISAEKIEQVVDSIEAELRRRNSIEVKSAVIGNLVSRKLKGIDKIAYIRFASVYREFTDLDSFQEELKRLLKKQQLGKAPKDSSLFQKKPKSKQKG